jgi:hypothetical protein
MDSTGTNDQGTTCNRARAPAETSQCIDWFVEGQKMLVTTRGVNVVVGYVARRGRRCRISVMAPAGATFEVLGPNGTGRSQDRVT